MRSFLNINSTCTSCDNCRLICPENSILVYNNNYHIDAWSCTLCSLCIEICPENSIDLLEFNSNEEENLEYR